MREIALGTITTMLGIYTAILVIAWQHVSDRYTPKILPAFLRHTAKWPLIGFAALLIFSGGLALHPLQNLLTAFPAQRRIHISPLVGDTISFLFLLGSIGVVVWASYKLARYQADGAKIISWLHDEEDRRLALQEALLSAIQRGDQSVTATILEMALLSAQKSFLDWLGEHRDLLSTDWFVRDLQRLLLSNELDAATTRIYADILCLLLTRALDDEAFPRAREVMQSIIDALSRASSLDQAHADLLERMGFALWKTGETSGYELRTARIPRQLTNIQSHFIGDMRSILSHILDMKCQQSMEAFSLALGKLAFVTREGELRGPFFDSIHEMMERGFTAKLLPLHAIQEMVSTLGYMQIHPDGYEDATQERIDALVIDLCAMFVELGGTKEALRQLVEKGALLARRNKQGGLSAHIDTWLRQECYNIVARELALHDFEYHPITLMPWDGQW